jgi:hypothetical protein
MLVLAKGSLEAKLLTLVVVDFSANGSFPSANGSNETFGAFPTRAETFVLVEAEVGDWKLARVGFAGVGFNPSGLISDGRRSDVPDDESFLE